MGLHGNPVLNFPADFEDVNYFSITPLVNAGYTRGTESTISVIKHNITPNEIKDSNGNLVLTASFNIWSIEGLVDGNCIETEDNVYRLQKSNDWDKQAGFFVYDAIRLVGDDSGLTNDVEFSEGEDDFE